GQNHAFLENRLVLRADLGRIGIPKTNAMPDETGLHIRRLIETFRSVSQFTGHSQNFSRDVASGASRGQSRQASPIKCCRGIHESQSVARRRARAEATGAVAMVATQGRAA